LFPEHRTFLPGEPLAETLQRLRRAAPEKKLIAEAASVGDAIAAAEAGFDVIQTEKFSPLQVAELIEALPASASRRPLIAAAGGITADNAAAYAHAGADILVTSAPYLARPRDVEVSIKPIAPSGAVTGAVRSV
jgi:molybdenum transport protein